MVLWMYVTKDKYELPLAVADSAVELSRIIGVNENTIRSSASHVNKKSRKRSSYRRVEVEDDE